MATTTQMRTEVSQVYVALFGRAPDAEGLNFWAGLRDSGQTIAQLADAMFGTSPARAYLPASLTHQEIISSFYFNMLGRTADADGLALWTAKLDAVGATPGSVIAEMIGIVTHSTSAALFNNRVAAAQFYSEHNGSIENAKTVLAGVTDSPATVMGAQTLIVAPGTAGSLNAAGFTEIAVGALSGDLVLTHVGQGTGLTLMDSTSPLPPSGSVPPWTLTYRLDDANSSSDSVRITLRSGDALSAGYIDLPGVEQLLVASVGTDAGPHQNSLFLTDESLESLVLTGNAGIDFPYSAIGVDRFDASGLSGATWASARSLTGKTVSLLGGPGNDTLTVWGPGAVVAGAGDDNISAGEFSSVTGGSGADSFDILLGDTRDLFVTITDFSVSDGDQIGLRHCVDHGRPGWNAQQLRLGAGLTFYACLDAAASQRPGGIDWFQFGGDTYVVVDNSGQLTFQDGTDHVVKLTGLIDLRGLTLDAYFTLG